MRDLFVRTLTGLITVVPPVAFLCLGHRLLRNVPGDMGWLALLEGVLGIGFIFFGLEWCYGVGFIFDFMPPRRRKPIGTSPADETDGMTP